MFLQRYVRIEMKFHYFIYAFFKASAYLSNRIVILKKSIKSCICLKISLVHRMVESFCELKALNTAID